MLSPRMGKGDGGGEYNNYSNTKTHFAFCVISIENPSICCYCTALKNQVFYLCFATPLNWCSCNVVAYQDYFRVMVSLNLLAFMWKGLRPLACGCWLIVLAVKEYTVM